MTPEDQIRAARGYTHDSIAITVFAHGTIVLCKDIALAPRIMAAYDVPNDGEGSIAGDIQPLPMDDGHTLITFAAPGLWKEELPDGQAFRVASDDDLVGLAATAVASPTEVFQQRPRPVGILPSGEVVRDTRYEALLGACIAARAARTKDAKDPVIVANWSPCSSASGTDAACS